MCAAWAGDRGDAVSLLVDVMIVVHVHCGRAVLWRWDLGAGFDC